MQGTIEDNESEDIEEKRENNFIANDPVRKHQLDHNRNTCLINNYPEIFVDQNGTRINNEGITFAPAEGNYPANILNERNWDIKSWPSLHPDGRNGLHHIYLQLQPILNRNN